MIRDYFIPFCFLILTILFLDYMSFSNQYDFDALEDEVSELKTKIDELESKIDALEFEVSWLDR